MKRGLRLSLPLIESVLSEIVVNTKTPVNVNVPIISVVPVKIEGSSESLEIIESASDSSSSSPVVADMEGAEQNLVISKVMSQEVEYEESSSL